jgi:hypothetical protein
MIQIEKTEVFGFESAIRGMRNPMNSWDKSDTCFKLVGSKSRETMNNWQIVPEIGPNDLKLMKQLIKAGTDHFKFMRMINVTCDITAPLYWWKEYDTYKVGTVRDSCSTMHKIHAKEFTLDDFSHEHLIGYDNETRDIDEPLGILNIVIDALNVYRNDYLDCNDKSIWWQMIQLLPSSYNQKATVQLNYAVLRNMYHSRKNHKLDEWHKFCHWIESLPYSELITMETRDD